MMIIDNKICYVHIPRTGGMYLRSFLSLAGIPFKSVGNVHSSLHDTSRYPTVSVIRNPYSWYVSAYLMFFSKIYGEGSFNERFDLIPDYGKMIKERHKYVDKILRHDNLIFDLSKYFGIYFGKHNNVNVKIRQGIDYKKFYNDETKEKVFNSCRDIIGKYEFCFGGT